MKKVETETRNIEVITKITVDGVEYPITPRNREVISEYMKTKNEEVLERLHTLTLSF